MAQASAPASSPQAAAVPRLTRFLPALAFALGLLASLPAHAQLPPPGTPGITINTTPITGGTTGNCLYDNAGKVGEQACGGTATSIVVGTTLVTSGTTLRVLYDNAGTLGEYTNTQLTALINPATATLSGALPAWPNNTTTYFRGDGTYQTLNCAAISGAGTGCSAASGITALTGDVTASGPGSVAATLATAQPAVHTWALAQTFSVAPVFTDQSGSRAALGLGTAATQSTGTSGATLPFLNGNNTYSGSSTFTGMFGIGSGGLSNVGLNFGGTISNGSGSVFGVYMGGLSLAPSSTNNAYFQYFGGGSIATGGATVANGYAGYSAAITKSGGGTITNLFGLYLETQTAGSNNYSLWSNGDTVLNAQTFAPNITTSSAAQTGTVCWTTGTGKFTVDTTVGCLTSIRAAKNVLAHVASSDALDIIVKLDAVSFRYKAGHGDGGRYEQFGFIAEQVALVDERLVGRDPNGTLQGVRYQELTAVLAGAVRELKAANDNLRSANDSLAARLAKIEAVRQ